MENTFLNTSSAGWQVNMCTAWVLNIGRWVGRRVKADAFHWPLKVGRTRSRLCKRYEAINNLNILAVRPCDCPFTLLLARLLTLLLARPSVHMTAPVPSCLSDSPRACPAACPPVHPLASLLVCPFARLSCCPSPACPSIRLLSCYSACPATFSLIYPSS